MLLRNMRFGLLAVVCLWVMSGCASTDSRDWQQRTEKDFPAGVNSIITQLGNVLDANSGLGYGSWTVTFGEGGPYATYECPKGGICEIKVSNLQCSQFGSEGTPCELIMYKNAICEVVIPDKRKTFEIGCPLDIALKSKGEGVPAAPDDAAAAAASAAAAAAAAKRSQEAAGVAPSTPKGAGEAGAPRPAPKGTEQAGAAATAPKAAEQAAAAPAQPKKPSQAAASAPKEQAKGQSAAGDFVFGARAGVVVPTQQILENVSSGTSVGPLVNLEGYYVLREWVRLGVMFEWHQFNVSTGDVKLGTLRTYSFLPTVEFRPTREMMRESLGFEWVVPYASLGVGVNVHSFSSATQLGNAAVSFPSTAAFRVAGGLDFPITQTLALNTEVAWKKDSGTFETGGRESNFNASPLMFLFGLRVHF